MKWGAAITVLCVLPQYGLMPLAAVVLIGMLVPVVDEGRDIAMFRKQLQ